MSATETAAQYDAAVGRLMRAIDKGIRSLKGSSSRHVCDALLTLLINVSRDSLRISRRDLEMMLVRTVRQLYPATGPEPANDAEGASALTVDDVIRDMRRAHDVEQVAEVDPSIVDLDNLLFHLGFELGSAGDRLRREDHLAIERTAAEAFLLGRASK